MNKQMFWEMHFDGRLETLAQENPLEFDILCDEILTQAMEEGGTHADNFREVVDMLTVKLLWDSLTFDERSALIRDYPEVSKRRIRRVILANRNLVCNIEHIERAKCLQWRIDSENKRHATALGACVALIRMMNERMWGRNGLSDALNGTHEYYFKKGKDITPPKPDCKVLSFNPKTK